MIAAPAIAAPNSLSFLDEVERLALFSTHGLKLLSSGPLERTWSFDRCGIEVTARLESDVAFVNFMHATPCLTPEAVVRQIELVCQRAVERDDAVSS